MRNDDDDYGPLYTWWQPRNYCYTCGWLSRLPLIGGPIIRWHFRRMNRASAYWHKEQDNGRM